MADRHLYEIATEIRKDWGNVNYAALPYLDAMGQLARIDDAYGCDDARGIVSYFLANARAWRGETARRVKAELKAMLAEPKFAMVRPETVLGSDGALIGFVIPEGFFS